MAHTEFGFLVVRKFLTDIAAYGHQDFEPKLIGRGINVMISPLPRNKRAKHPRAGEAGHNPPSASPRPAQSNNDHPPAQAEQPAATDNGNAKPGGLNNPFAELDARS
jgi:translation initiation factor IF-3